MKRIHSIPLLLVFLVSMYSCAVKNPVTGKTQLFVMSEEREIAMGTEYDPQIIASMGLYEDAVLQKYIEEKGKEMGAISHRPHLTYHFRIVDESVVNAFAVPGGFVYFTRGIMAHFNNEAEFAGVLGHEIGHITARHSVKQQRDQMLAQVGLIAGMIAAPELAQFGNSASQGLGLLMLKFGREAESQSDELGVEYSSKIGYDAHEMAEFFNTLHRKQEVAGVAIPEFLSTHPSPEGRREKVHEHAVDWQAKLNMEQKDVGRNSYLSMIDGLVYGEDPRQGFVENGTFFHPELKFNFDVPGGWQHQNSPSQFQMADESGKGMMVFGLGDGTSLEDVSAKLVEQYQLEVVSKKNRTINGISAMELTTRQVQQAQTAQQQTETQAQPALKIKMMIYDYAGLFYTMLAASTEADFPSYENTFDSTFESFEQLTDQAKLNKQPERVRIKTVQSSGSVSSVLSSFGTPSERLEELSILNGMELTDMVQSGSKIKTIGN